MNKQNYVVHCEHCGKDYLYYGYNGDSVFCHCSAINMAKEFVPVEPGDEVIIPDDARGHTPGFKGIVSKIINGYACSDMTHVTTGFHAPRTLVIIEILKILKKNNGTYIPPQLTLKEMYEDILGRQ